MPYCLNCKPVQVYLHSVMSAIDEKYASADEFELIDELNKVSGTPVPNAIEEIRNAEIRHDLECDADRMKDTVKQILGGLEYVLYLRRRMRWLILIRNRITAP